MTDLILHPGTVVVGNLLEEWSYDRCDHVPLDILNTVASIDVDWTAVVGPTGSASLVVITKTREAVTLESLPAGADCWGIKDADGRLLWAQRFSSPTDGSEGFTLHCSPLAH